MSKPQFREMFSAKRQTIATAERAHAAALAVKWLLTSSLFHDSHHIACYLARKDEFDTLPLIHAIWQAKKNCYLPVLSLEKNNHLDFVLYQPDDVLHLNRYKILEPKNITSLFPTEKLDIVLLPLISFDHHGNRLGAGGGYYDRTFADTKKPFLLGVGYQLQQAEALPHEAWDVRLQGVLTETALKTSLPIL